VKGLADILGKGSAAKLGPKPPVAPVEEQEKPETDASPEKGFARMASEATASGDHDAAADALVSAIKACMSGYGPKA
jgi:hypothetical protein